MDHEIRQLYFDVAGAEMEKAAFLKRYPGRATIARTAIWGALVCTEFSGIDHRVAREAIGALHWPLIYETTVRVQIHGCKVVRSFAWSGGFRRARCWHWLACAFGSIGGVLWWRYRAYETY